MPTRGTATTETVSALVANLDRIPHLLTTVDRDSAVNARNRLAAAVKSLGETAPAISRNGWICLWVDSDAWWPAGTIRRMATTLLSRPEVDVLTGWFCGRSAHSNPCSFYEDWTWPVVGEDCARGDIVEITRSGFHFVMHKAELLDRLSEKPFTVTDPCIKDGSGEDFAFCDNVRKAGGRIWADTGALVAHVADDGLCYLPGESAFKVVGGNLRRVEGQIERVYDSVGV